MKVILNKEVANLGLIGDLVNVKNGYARNYLLPRQLASVANEENKAAYEHHMRILKKRRDQALSAAQAIGNVIEKTSVTITKKVGEEEKIYGSVTTTEIEELLLKEGIEISKKDIEILEPIKKIGVYQAKAHLHAEVKPTFKIWVVAETE